MQGRMNARRYLQRLIDDYSEEEFNCAERKVCLLPLWRRTQKLIDEILEASYSDMYQERVVGGSMPIPDAQRIIEKKESHPEYQRISRNISAVEMAFSFLPEKEQEFVSMFFFEEVCHQGDHMEHVANLLGWGRRTVGRWRKKCLRGMMPFLEDVDTILIRAKYAEKLCNEKQ